MSEVSRQKWEDAGKDFLARYMLAFLTQDGKTIGALYSCPCVLLRGDGAIVALASPERVAEFFDAVAAKLYQDGCRDWRYSDLEVTPMGGGACLVSVDWEPLAATGDAIRRWRQSYVLVRNGGAPVVMSSVFHGS